MKSATPTAIVPVGSGTSPDSHPLQKYQQEIDPEAILDQQAAALHRLQELQVDIFSALKNLPVGSQAYNFTLKSYAVLHKEIQAQQLKVQEASQALLQHIEERGHKQRWEQLAAQLLDQLMAAYGHLGPQYHILIRRLAFAEVRAQQMEEAGRADTDEWRKLAIEVRNLIASLQKYTEAEKREVVNTEVQQAVIAVLEIVEAQLANRYPLVWQQIVHQVEARVGENDE